MDMDILLLIPITAAPVYGGAYGTVTAGYGPASKRQAMTECGSGVFAGGETWRLDSAARLDLATRLAPAAAYGTKLPPNSRA